MYQLHGLVGNRLAVFLVREETDAAQSEYDQFL